MKIRIDKMPFAAYSVRRYWSGRIINIWLGRYLVVIDLRNDWVIDMTNGKMKHPKEPPHA